MVVRELAEAVQAVTAARAALAVLDGHLYAARCLSGRASLARAEALVMAARFLLAGMPEALGAAILEEESHQYAARFAEGEGVR